VLTAVSVACGVLGFVLQVVLSPAAYDSLSNVGISLAVAGIVLIVLLIVAAAGRKRQILRALSRDHPDAFVQLVSLEDEGQGVVTAGVLVDAEGLAFSSKQGVLRRVGWSRVRSIKTIPWRVTIRTGLEVMIDDETLRLIPISPWTLFPVSERRSAIFFDAIRKSWRLHRTSHLPQSGP
jgi:hypothetical protein